MGQGQSSVQKHVLHEYQLQHHMSSMTDGRSSRFPHVALARRQWRQREFKVGGAEPCEPTVRLPD